MSELQISPSGHSGSTLISDVNSIMSEYLSVLNGEYDGDLLYCMDDFWYIAKRETKNYTAYLDLYFALFMLDKKVLDVIELLKKEINSVNIEVLFVDKIISNSDKYYTSYFVNNDAKEDEYNFVNIGIHLSVDRNKCPVTMHMRLYYLIHHLLNMFVMTGERLASIEEIKTNSFEDFWESIIINSVISDKDTYYSITEIAFPYYGFLAINDPEILSRANEKINKTKVVKQTGLLQLFTELWIEKNIPKPLAEDAEFSVAISNFCIENPDVIFFRFIGEYCLYTRLKYTTIYKCEKEELLNFIKNGDWIVTDFETALFVCSKNLTDHITREILDNLRNNIIKKVSLSKITYTYIFGKDDYPAFDDDSYSIH